MRELLPTVRQSTPSVLLPNAMLHAQKQSIAIENILSRRAKFCIKCTAIKRTTFSTQPYCQRGRLSTVSHLHYYSCCCQASQSQRAIVLLVGCTFPKRLKRSHNPQTWFSFSLPKALGAGYHTASFFPTSLNIRQSSPSLESLSLW